MEIIFLVDSTTLKQYLEWATKAEVSSSHLARKCVISDRGSTANRPLCVSQPGVWESLGMLIMGYEVAFNVAYVSVNLAVLLGDSLIETLDLLLFNNHWGGGTSPRHPLDLERTELHVQVNRIWSHHQNIAKFIFLTTRYAPIVAIICNLLSSSSPVFHLCYGSLSNDYYAANFRLYWRIGNKVRLLLASHTFCGFESCMSGMYDVGHYAFGYVQRVRFLPVTA